MKSARGACVGCVCVCVAEHAGIPGFCLPINSVMASAVDVLTVAGCASTHAEVVTGT